MAQAGRHGATRYVAYGDRVHVGGTLAWRNNNPGNLRDSDFSRAQGAVARDSAGFAIFPDEATGRAAQEALLGTRTYQGLSVGEAVARYAPANENDTEAYTRFVEGRLADRGFDRASPMSDLSAEDRGAMASAMRDFEGNQAGTVYTRENAPDWARPLLDPPPALPKAEPYAPPVATVGGGGNATFNDGPPVGEGAGAAAGPADVEGDVPAPPEPGGAPIDPAVPPDEPTPLLPLCDHGIRHVHPDWRCCCGSYHVGTPR